MSITKGKFPYETDLQVKSLSVSDNCGLSGITTFSGVVKLSGTLDSTLGNIQFIDGVQSKQGIPSITPISTKFFNYTLSNLNERDTIIDMRMTVANTVTIPADTILNFPVGTTIDIL